MGKVCQQYLSLPKELQGSLSCNPRLMVTTYGCLIVLHNFDPGKCELLLTVIYSKRVVLFELVQCYPLFRVMRSLKVYLFQPTIVEEPSP